MIVPVNKVPGYGRYVNKMCRNQVIPDGLKMAGLAGDANMLAGRRLKRHFEKWIRPEDAYSAAGSRRTWITRSYTSLNLKALKARVLLVPAANGFSASPYYQWAVDVGGAGAVNQVERYVPGSSAVVGTFDLDDIFVDEVTLTDDGTPAGAAIAGDKEIDLSLTVVDGARVIGATVYEVPLDQLDTDVHTACRTDRYGVGAAILTAGLDDPVETAWALYKRNGAPLIGWCTDDGAPVTQNSATYKNVLDGTTTGWAATAAGFPILPRYRHRQVTTGVNVVFWVRAKTDAGSTGRVRFVGSGGTIATITGIGTTEAFHSVQATIDGTLDDDLIIVECSDSTPNTVSVYAAGAYEWLA